MTCPPTRKQWKKNATSNLTTTAMDGGFILQVKIFSFWNMKKRNLLEYIKESHELVLEDVASDQLKMNVEINVDNRDIYGAALLDGCTEQQAMLTVAGADLTIPDADIPPIGWYRCKHEYALIFCNERELVEDRENETQFIKRTSFVPEEA